MTLDLATPYRVITPIDWANFWMLFWALVAVGLLRATVANFDRWLGRVETVFARLAHPSRWAQIAAMLCFTLGTISSLGRSWGGPSAARTFWMNGVTFTVALFLLGAASATSLFDGRDVGGVDLFKTRALSSSRIVLAKQVCRNCRLLPPLLIVPAWVVIRCGTPLSGLLLLIAYLLSISAAVISLGEPAAYRVQEARYPALAVMNILLDSVQVVALYSSGLRTQTRAIS